MRVLIAEDDAASRRVLEYTLRREYEVVSAADGEQALAALLDENAPRLAVLDWMMPGLDGPEVVRRVREMAEGSPPYLILLTARNQTADMVEGLGAGADDYLTKPFNRDELRARIEVGARVIELRTRLASRVSELEEVMAERHRAEQQLEESERFHRELYERSSGLICTHDLKGAILTVNPAAARALGYEPSEVVGRNLADFTTAASLGLLSGYLDTFRARPSQRGLASVKTRGGDVRVWMYDNTLCAEPGGAPYVLGHAQDVTDLKRKEEMLRSLSLTDDLTGLYNRRGFLALAEQHFSLTHRTPQHLLLFYADMDGLKRINDLYGHQEGSAALRRVADILRQTFRATDVIARVGGDEFTVLAINAAPASAEAAVVRLRENLREYNARRSRGYELSLSIGWVECGPGAVSFEESMARADAEMYREKRAKSAGASRTQTPGQLRGTETRRVERGKAARGAVGSGRAQGK